jgi:hypothetical protein
VAAIPRRKRPYTDFADRRSSHLTTQMTPCMAVAAIDESKFHNAGHYWGLISASLTTCVHHWMWPVRDSRGVDPNVWNRVSGRAANSSSAAVRMSTKAAVG